MGNAIAKQKDGTAQGVAKVRHYESLFPPDQQMYYDPYAYGMYPGSILQTWMGPTTIDKVASWMGIGGISELLSVRTKWFDDEILKTLTTEEGNDNNHPPAKQLIILGAGYDTRGFRLDFPANDDGEKKNSFKVIEVDQPDVQTKKIAKLDWLSKNMKKEDEEYAKRITNRMESGAVEFVPVDFNTDSLEEKLQSHTTTTSNNNTPLVSVVLMEGVTQYIPKESTADTLKKLKKIVAPGSTLLITYVDQNTFDDPTQVVGGPGGNIQAVERIVKVSGSVGEPWISGWTESDFESFLKDCGYQVTSNTTTKDYNDKYLEPVKRKREGKDLLSMERWVVAKLL